MLASGKGMAYDLRAKFDFLRPPTKGARLVILWPGDPVSGDPADKLPPATRKVWDDEATCRPRAELRRCGDGEIVVLLAFRNLLAEAEAAERTPPADAVREFLQRKADKLLPLLLPPTGGKGTDEN